MPKKQITDVVANVRTSGLLNYSDADQAAATSLGIVLAGTVEERVGRAIYAFNNATRYAVEAGYLLLSVKAEVEHGQFEPGVEGLGLSRQRAAELMRMAKFATALPETSRAEMLMLPKSKVLALAGADASVIEDLLANAEDGDLTSLSVRELRQRIKDAEKLAADLSVQRDTFEAERDGLAKKLKKRARDAEDHEGTPMLVADIRAEVAALVKKAELSVDSMYPLLVELASYSGHEALGEWVRPSVRLAVSGLLGLRLQIDGVIGRCANVAGVSHDSMSKPPEALAFLDESEVVAIAEEWPRLIAAHQHEAALREHERKQAQPRGKGRPTKAPKALETK